VRKHLPTLLLAALLAVAVASVCAEVRALRAAVEGVGGELRMLRALVP